MVHQEHGRNTVSSRDQDQSAEAQLPGFYVDQVSVVLVFNSLKVWDDECWHSHWVRGWGFSTLLGLSKLTRSLTELELA